MLKSKNLLGNIKQLPNLNLVLLRHYRSTRWVTGITWIWHDMACEKLSLVFDRIKNTITEIFLSLLYSWANSFRLRLIV